MLSILPNSQQMLSTHHYHPALGQVMLASLMRAISPGSKDVEMINLKTSVLRVAFRVRCMQLCI